MGGIIGLIAGYAVSAAGHNKKHEYGTSQRSEQGAQDLP